MSLRPAGSKKEFLNTLVPLVVGKNVEEAQKVLQDRGLRSTLAIPPTKSTVQNINLQTNKDGRWTVQIS